MKKFTKICLILAGIFGILGVGMLGGAMALGATSMDVNSKLSNSRVWNRVSEELSEGWMDFWDEGSEFDFISSRDVPLSQADGEYHTYDYSDVDTIEVDVKRCAVYLERSEDSDVHVAVDSNGGNQKVQVEQSGDTVSVSCNSKARPETEIYLSIPDTEMDKIDISVGGGYLSIDEMSAKEVAVSVGSGMVETNGSVRAEKSYWEVGAGTMEVCMAGREEDYDYEIPCGVGIVDLPGDSYSGLGTAKTIENENSEYEMEIQCGVGNIEFVFEE